MSELQILSDDELVDLTGYKHKKKQVLVLERFGIHHKVRWDGSACVFADSLWSPVELMPPRELPVKMDGPASIIDGQCVYFMQFIGKGGDEGLVKIGTTGQLRVRRHQIPAELGFPHKQRWFRVLGTIPGGRDLEQELHAKFDNFREFGEWFAPDPDLCRYPLENYRNA